MNNLSVSPRTKASLEIKSFLRSIKVKSSIRSKVTKKNGFEIFIHMDELSRPNIVEFHNLINDIKLKYDIKNITVHEKLPW